MVIASKQNPQIRQVRALSNRKSRRETGLFFVEGIRLVGEAVQLEASIATLIVAPELLTSSFGHEVVRDAQQAGIPHFDVTSDVFRHISQKDGPQGLAAIVRQKWHDLETVTEDSTLGWVVLEEVRNPGNLGTILRTCDAVGGAGVILLGDSTDPFDPAAVRGSMGALFSQKLVRTDRTQLTEWIKTGNVNMVGASDDASIEYTDMRYERPTILCMGNEQHGLSTEYRGLCRDVVRIPMVGRSDSLNLAVATGVILYEIFNQHKDI
jgi:RNA methyltransferase, TrmH family